MELAIKSQGGVSMPLAKDASAKWSYISLIYSLFFFFPIALSWGKFSNLQLAGALAIYCVFILLFLFALKQTGRTAALAIIGIILLATFGSAVNPGSNALFGYASFLGSFYFKRHQAWLLLFFNLGMQMAAAHTLDLFYIYFLGPSMAVSISLHIYGRFSQKEWFNRLEHEQKNLQIEQLAAIAERERIARDMHDLLGHSLSSLALKSELASKLIDRGEHDKASEEIQQVAELARQSLAEVREAVTGLKQKSLSGCIADLVVQVEKLGYQTDTQLDIPPLAAKTESCLTMLCKEWLTNILRHSKGSNINITLNHDANKVFLKIADNGSATYITPGNGIQGMKSRIAELGGTFSLTFNSGVTLAVTLPNQA